MAADPIDERYDEIVRGLRALPGAPAELRGRVLELAATADTPRPRRRGLQVALGLSLAIVAAVAAISLTSGGSRPGQQKLAGEAASRAAPHRAVFAPATGAKPNALDSAVGLPVTPGRLTEVHASLRLRVRNVDGLSKATAQAMRITRRLGGFVQSVDYGTPSGGNGDAYLTVRIPVGNVQRAVARFAALGSILSQHLSIRDLQNQSNAEVLRILQLPTRKGAAAVPSHPSPIERAARHAFSALSKTIAGLLYALIVLSTLLVLAAAVLWGARYR